MRQAARLVGLMAVAAGAFGVFNFFRKWARTNQGTPNFPPPQLWPQLLKNALVMEPLLDLAAVTSAYRSGATQDKLREQNLGAVEHSAHELAAADDLVPRPGFTLDDVLLAAEAFTEGKHPTLKKAFVHGGTHVHVELMPDLSWSDVPIDARTLFSVFFGAHPAFAPPQNLALSGERK